MQELFVGKCIRRAQRQACTMMITECDDWSLKIMA